MADQQHPFAPVFARQHVYDGAQAQDDIAPAFAARRTVVELAQQPPQFGLLRVLLDDACVGQPVQNAELPLPQTFIHRQSLFVLKQPGTFHRDLRRLAGAFVGRSPHDRRRFFRRQTPEPIAQCPRLAFAEGGQRHIGVAHRNVNNGMPGGFGGVTGDIARAFAVPDKP